MRRLLIVSLLAASGLLAATLALSSSDARRRPDSLRSQLESLRLPPIPSLKPGPQRTIPAVPAPAPYVQGFACPVAGGSPCSSPPCTVYVAPSPGGGPTALARPACSQREPRSIPVTAR